MRLLYTILFFASIALIASRSTVYTPAKYYFAASGDDATGSGTLASPWKTITKLNAVFSTFGPGDSALFKRGDTFVGGIVTAASGSSGAPIVIGAYGTGNRPIITGFTTVTGWANVGGPLYEAPLNSGARLNMLTIDSVTTYPGRYPNPGAANYGFLVVDASYHLGVENASAKIKSSGVSGLSGLVGSELVNIANPFTINSRELVTAHSNDTITYTTKSQAQATIGYGFFFQGASSFLDTTNEWYYDPVANTIRIYGNPTAKVVKASTVSDLVTISGKSYLTFTNIDFQGADSAFFRISGTSSYISVLNCKLNFSGSESITVGNTGATASYLDIENNEITNTNGFGVLCYSTSHSIFKNNALRKAGVYVGGGRWGTAGYGGIYMEGGYNKMNGNVVDSVGGAGIGFTGGDSIDAINNYVTNYCMVEKDAGGIYSNNSSGVGCRIWFNIVGHGIGSGRGTTDLTPGGANGIYLDESRKYVSVMHNTVFDVPSYCIYLHQAEGNTVMYNTLYPVNPVSTVAGGITSRDDYSSHPTRNTTNKIFNNLIYLPVNNNAQPIEFYTYSRTTDVWNNSVDSNIYIRPNMAYGTVRVTNNNGSDYHNYDPAGAYTKYSFEQHGQSLWNIPPYSVTSLSGSNIYSAGNFTSGSTSGISSPSMTISVESKLDGNSLKIAGTVDSTVQRYTEIDFGSATSGIYRVRFSMIGSTNTENMLVRFGSNSSYISENLYGLLRTTRTENEFYVSVPTTSHFKIDLFFHDNTPFWLDNIDVQKVNTATIALSDSITFRYNPNGYDSTVTLGANYRDAYGTAYTGRITLPPYASAILRREINASPVASAGSVSSITLPTSSKALSGSGTDADGTISAYKWTQVSGPSTGTFSSSTVASPTVSALTVAGAYVFQLRVTDNAGYQDSATVTITVNSNPPPVANAGTDITITLPVNSTSLNGTASTDDGSLTYNWAKTSGPSTYTLTGGNTSTPTVSGMVAGTYVFTLTVTDNGSLTASDAVQVTVNGNIPPVAMAGNDAAITLPVSSITLTGSGTDDVAVVSYGWTKISGPSTYAIVSPSSATTDVTGMSAGTYVFRLLVTDNGGATATDDVQITVNPAPNIPPVANAGADKSITLPINTVSVVGSGTDADGTVVNYAWSKVSGPSTYTIASPSSSTTALNGLVQGVYVFRLTVTDNLGATHFDDVTVLVNPVVVPATDGIRSSKQFYFKSI